MKLVKYFDIHDAEVTPVVYTLFFALVELKGNDLVYKQYPECWNVEAIDEEIYESLDLAYQKQLKRGWKICYHNENAMKSFCENPPPIKEAVSQCWKWLESQGITMDDDSFFVKIWW